MTKRLILGIFAAMILSAQTVGATPARPSECKAWRPQVLKQYIFKQSELEAQRSAKNKFGQNGGSTGVFWTVYSDRSGNNCYEDSKGNVECGKLAFGEEVRIADIDNGRALVYIESDNSTRYPQISSSAVVKGWVPIDNLLLWPQCPTNERYIYHKALIVANMDEVKGDPDFAFYFTNPQTKEGKGGLKSRMEFLYVMKTDKQTGKVLLATESLIDPRGKSFFGWVSPGTYIEWEERTCLELTWDRDARRKFQENGVKSIPVKDTKSGDVSTSVVLNEKNKVSSNNPQDEWRLDPRILRYPLLSTGASDYVATVFAREGNNVNAQSMIANAAMATEKIDRLVDDMRVVNIIVVIDGTKGMENAFHYVQRAVERAYNEYFLKENREVRVGGVIYRDYDYRQGAEQCTCEILPMTTINDAKLKRFFAGGTYGVKNSPTDKEDYEALYKGLDAALNASAMNYKKENNNLMFVIGDCGNRPDDSKAPKVEDIVRKCVENRIQLSAFQVRNLDMPATNLFIDQMGEIVRDNMNRQYVASLGDSQVKVKYKEVPFGADFNPAVQKENTYFIGGYRYPDPNTDMDEARLYELLKSTAQRFDEAMVRQVKVVENAEEIASSEDTDAVSTYERNFLKSFLGENAYKLLKENQYIMAKKGSVPQKSDFGVNYWEPVIYISSREFRRLMDGLGIVVRGIDQDINSPTLRHDYVEAMKSLVRTMLPGISESQMDNLSNSQIMDQISGLNYRTKAMASALNSYSLRDIEDPNVVSNEKFQSLISNFEIKYKNLQRIRDNKYNFSITRGKETYYWIPADDLP